MSARQLARAESPPAELDIERARAMIAKCVRVDEAKRYRDKALAFELYLRRQRAASSAARDAADIAVRATHKMGQLAAAQVERGRPKKKVEGADHSSTPRKTLVELGLTKDESSVAQRLGKFTEDELDRRLERAHTEGKPISARSIVALTASPEHDGDEWKSPELVADVGRVALGGHISVDPATTAEANKVIRAETIWTKLDANGQGGLAYDWPGEVYLNPPFSMPLVYLFTRKLAQQLEAKITRRAFLVVNNATDTAWCQALMALRFPFCLPAGRIAFIDPKTGRPVRGNNHGQLIFLPGIKSKYFSFIEEKLGPVYLNSRGTWGT